MTRNKWASLLTTAIFAIAVLAFAQEFTSTDFKVLDPVIKPGGYSNSTDFQLIGVIQQIAIGRSTDTSFGVNAGFLYFPAVSAPTVSVTPSAVDTGGGGFIAPSPPPPGAVTVFSGSAYPGSIVTILQDAQVVAQTTAGGDAQFKVVLSGLGTGNFIFSVLSEDNQGRKSGLLNFPLALLFGATTNITDIFVPPTLAFDKSEVKKGDNISALGQSVAFADITIAINDGRNEFTVKTKSDKDGFYVYNLNTGDLQLGQYFAKSQAAIGGRISPLSKTASFTIGTKNVAAAPIIQTPAKGDINKDRRVNLVDFSIAAYWWKRPSPPAEVDLNSDGVVDLKDFSIMAFYWTG